MDELEDEAVATDNNDNKVIVLKDYVPAWVKDAYLTKEEIDTWNEEYDLQAKSQQTAPAPAQSEPPAPEST